MGTYRGRITGKVRKKMIDDPALIFLVLFGTALIFGAVVTWVYRSYVS